MATEYARLVFKVDSAGLAKAQTQLDGIRKKSGGASQETEKLTREIKLLSAAAGTLAAVALKKSIVTVAQFSQEIANLSAITGAAGKDLEFYEKQARQIGATTSLSASQAAIAFKLIASAKPDLLNSAEALADVTKQAVILSEATGIDLPASAAALGSALNQFQIDAGDASKVINILAASSKYGTAEVGSVTEALRNAGSAANSLGIDLVETVAGIQALAAAGKQGSDAGTALRQVLLKLEKTGNSELQPSIVGLTGALDELSEMNLSSTELMELFGEEAFAAATALLSQRDAVATLNESLRDTSVAIEQQSTRMDTLIGDWKQFNSVVEEAQIETFGGDFEDLSRYMLQASTRWIGELIPAEEAVADGIERIGTEAYLAREKLAAFNDLLTGSDSPFASGEGSPWTMLGDQASGSVVMDNLKPKKPEVDPFADLFGPNDENALDDAGGRALYSGSEAGKLFDKAYLDMVAQGKADELIAANDHAQQLIDIEAARLEMIKEMDAEALQQKLDGYGVLFDAAGAYFDGLEGKEAAYARAALSIGETLLTEEGRARAKSVYHKTVEAAMGAYSALSAIPLVGPVLGAAAYASIMATGTSAAASMVTGGRELGGQVLPGNSYLVGERGPEILNMGSTGGNVSNKLGQAPQNQEPQEIIINQNITAMDSSSVQQVLSDNREYISGLISSVMNDRGMA